MTPEEIELTRIIIIGVLTIIIIQSLIIFYLLWRKRELTDEEIGKLLEK